MDVRFKISLEKITGIVQDFRNKIARAVETTLPKIQEIWSTLVLKRSQEVPVSRQKQYAQYAAAIQQPESLEYPVGGDAFYGRVMIQNSAATRVETGRPAWDMKPGLLSGPKARRGKKGQRYNVIPIGFSSPGGYDAWQFYGVSPFRTVSDFSPPNSWIYPARPGVHLQDEAIEEITPMAKEVIQNAIAEWRK